MADLIMMGTYQVRAPRMLGGVNRVGHHCEVIIDPMVPRFLSKIRFADGHEATVSRFLLRRLPDCRIVSDPCGGQTGNHVNRDRSAG